MTKENKKKSIVNYMHIFVVPWCCILPIAIAFFGLASGTLGAFLMQLTPFFFIITLISITFWIWSIFFRMRWENFIGSFG